MPEGGGSRLPAILFRCSESPAADRQHKFRDAKCARRTLADWRSVCQPDAGRFHGRLRLMKQKRSKESAHVASCEDSAPFQLTAASGEGKIGVSKLYTRVDILPGNILAILC